MDAGVVDPANKKANSCPEQRNVGQKTKMSVGLFPHNVVSSVDFHNGHVNR